MAYTVLIDSLRVEAFDHQKSTLAKVPEVEECPKNLILHIDPERSSATAVYDYFSKKLADAKPSEVCRKSCGA